MLAAIVALAMSALASWRIPEVRNWLGNNTVPELPEDICFVAPATPYDAASGRPIDAARDIPKHARCPVCGMYPARTPEWAAQMIFRGGDAYFFDSAMEMFVYLDDLDMFTPGRKSDDIIAIYVRDSTRPTPETPVAEWIDARKATYVHSSSALGPMRTGTFVTFATAQAAKDFIAKRGGESILYSDVSSELLDRLGAKNGHHHH